MGTIITNETLDETDYNSIGCVEKQQQQQITTVSNIKKNKEIKIV